MVVVDFLHFAEFELRVFIGIGLNLQKSILLFNFDYPACMPLKKFVSLTFLKATDRDELFACVFNAHGTG